MILNKTERIEDLQLDGLKIIQDGEKYCFTSDSAILSSFVSAKKNDVCLEIGCGNGVISILVAHKCKPKEIVAFEIQKESSELAKRNVELNNLEDKIKIINSPIQEFKKYGYGENFDVVFSNPPYIKVHEKSLINENEVCAISRHEIKLNLVDLVSCASKLLKFKGRFYMVHKAERLAEIFCELKKVNLEPKKLLFVSPSENKSPNIVLIEAVKGGKQGILVFPTLIANDKDGSYIYSIKKLLGGLNWFILLQLQLET